MDDYVATSPGDFVRDPDHFVLSTFPEWWLREVTFRNDPYLKDAEADLVFVRDGVERKFRFIAVTDCQIGPGNPVGPLVRLIDISSRQWQGCRVGAVSTPGGGSNFLLLADRVVELNLPTSNR